MPASKELYLGLMSGTSMDGIDAALVHFTDSRLELIAADCVPWPDPLQTQLQELATLGTYEIDRLGALDAQVGDCLADAALKLLKKAAISPAAVTAIGSHGQTIRHCPASNPAFTLQIGDPNRIAERTGITTVADFRRRDIAAGGEGAPLAPAFHADRFRDKDECRTVLNIGGIANITLLPPDPKAPITGFDTGPGNCLLDRWIRRHLDQPWDRNGAWGAGGETHPPLLNAMLADGYFLQPPPKSTGPEYFSTDWLEKQLASFPELAAQDIQATLSAFTAESISRAIAAHAPDSRRLLVCGGGVHNHALMQQLNQRLSPCTIESTATYGLDPDWVEAAAFAWLARRTLRGLPGNLPSVTGASHPVVLGGIYRS